ncbi:MAG TPA: hypothetical protein DHW64_10330 [Chitinophagaceae bacterium]|nr:hypothetical protein [Chitinophagaceae bacterium]
MNKENYLALCATLSRAGFQHLDRLLLQHICCRPARFTLYDKIPFNNDTLNCQILFIKNDDVYTTDFYEASLIRQLPMPDHRINNISLQELEATMMAINWQQTEIGVEFRLNDEATWLREKSIDSVMSDLLQLSAVEDGKVYADLLKLRFWTGTLMEQVTGSLTTARSRLEVSQRFYFLQTEGIGVDGAYRFLLNQWVEKRVKNRRKATAAEVTDNDTVTRGTKERKIVKKRKVGKVRKLI